MMDYMLAKYRRLDTARVNAAFIGGKYIQYRILMTFLRMYGGISVKIKIYIRVAGNLVSLQPGGGFGGKYLVRLPQKWYYKVKCG